MPFSENTGVFYPLQTFTSQSAVDITDVPVLIEANRIDNENNLLELAQKLSAQSDLVADSRQSTALHIAAVFASNFSNHMYDIARKILEDT